jgi:alanine racemase
MQALLHINLRAIVANWQLLCGRHGGGAVAAVLKADAYGLGAVEVARALREAGCRHFFVAHLQEALALRAALGEASAMLAVLNGFMPGAAPADIWPVVNHLDMARAHAGHGPVLLHVDTGMARLGLDLAECAAIPPGLDIRYVMSHLACADEPGHAMNARQAERFAVVAARFPGVATSLANSSGIFLGPGFGSDLARPGAGLFGINPQPGQPNPMAPVLLLEAPILQLRHIAAGVAVGYGAGWVAPRPSLIATVAAGYADGYLRALSGHGIGILAGRGVPVVGRISMDLTAFDVTGVPAALGDMLTLMGPDNLPDMLAERAGTIGYEMLTALGSRYRRIYT